MDDDSAGQDKRAHGKRSRVEARCYGISAELGRYLLKDEDEQDARAAFDKRWALIKNVIEKAIQVDAERDYLLMKKSGPRSAP